MAEVILVNLGVMPQLTSGLYLGILRDHAGTLLGPSDLTTLTLTEFDKDTLAIVNSRDGQNVLNTNGVTVYATLQTIVLDGITYTYNVAWVQDPADNAILVEANAYENRIALFVATWGSGRALRKQASWRVKNFAKVPAA